MVDPHNEEMRERALSEWASSKYAVLEERGAIRLPITGTYTCTCDPEGNVYAVKGTSPTKFEVFKSEDRGISWEKLWEYPDRLRARAFNYCPVNDFLLAGTDEPSVLIDGEKVFEPPEGNVISTDESKDGKLYCITSHCEPARVYRSVDGGKTWEEVLTISGTESSGWRFVYGGKGHLSEDRVIAGADPDFMRTSSDAGATWSDMPSIGHPYSVHNYGYYQHYMILAAENEILRFKSEDLPDVTYDRLFRNQLYTGELEKHFGQVCISRIGTIFVSMTGSLWIGLDAGERWVRAGKGIWRDMGRPCSSPEGYVYVPNFAEEFRDIPGEAYMLRLPEIPEYGYPSPAYGGDFFFWRFEIRDTADHYSDSWDSYRSVVNFRGFSKGTVFVNNGLDQDVTIQLQGSRQLGFDYVCNIGSSFTVSSGAASYETFTDPLPYLRLRASCATAPTSGALDAFCYKRR